jgi:hypothetical protein
MGNTDSIADHTNPQEQDEFTVPQDVDHTFFASNDVEMGAQHGHEKKQPERARWIAVNNN